MAAIPELIYCANGNKRYAEIATQAKFTYGAKLPNTVHLMPEFVDQDWLNPDFDKYRASLEQYRPRLASVLDWEREDQLSEVLDWAAMASEYVSEAVIIIPKVKGGAERLPETVGGVPVRLAFSYPTSYGKADWSILFEMAGWENGVHILGGPPHGAHWIANGLLPVPYRKPVADERLDGIRVVSVDGNLMLKMANKFAAFYDPLKQTPRGYWPNFKDFYGQPYAGGGKKGATYRAFEKSCFAIKCLWEDRLDELPKIGDNNGPES